jgi:dTDP-4-amino-4,6-dideoxygalactose transaminase
VHYIPIHLQPYYKSLGFKTGDYPNAENYYNRVISIPLFYDMTMNEHDKVVEALTEVLQ